MLIPHYTQNIQSLSHLKHLSPTLNADVTFWVAHLMKYKSKSEKLFFLNFFKNET